MAENDPRVNSRVSFDTETIRLSEFSNNNSHVRLSDITPVHRIPMTPEDRARKAFWAFGESMTPQIGGASGWVLTVFWIVAYIALSLVFAVQMMTLTTRYLEFGVNTELSIVRKTDVEFPAVTVCNNSPVRRSVVARVANYSSLAALDTFVQSVVMNGSSHFNCHDPYFNNMLTCPNTKECIPEHWMCDGLVDCLDGWDEGQVPDWSSGHSVNCSTFQTSADASFEPWNPGHYCMTGFIKCSEEQPLCAIPCDHNIECSDGLDESKQIGCDTEWMCRSYLNATEENQTLSSPGFPDSYIAKEACFWIIAAQEGEKVEMQFTSDVFGIEEKAGKCPYDFVTIFDGDNWYEDALEIDGRKRACGFEKPAGVITSSGNSAYVYFASDYNNQYSGFQITFRAIPSNDSHSQPDKGKRSLGRSKRSDYDYGFYDDYYWENYERYWAQEYSYELKNFDNVSYYQWVNAYNAASVPDYSDFRSFATFTQEEMRWFGTQAQDFIAQCTFDGRECDHQAFEQIQNPDYGNCYVFNSALSNRKNVRKTSNTGPKNGLKLTLFMPQSELIGILNHDAGARVVLSSPFTVSSPENEGFAVSMGASSKISIREESIIRQGGQYGKCATTWPDELQFSDQFKRQWPEYSQKVCESYCIQRHLWTKCHCVDNYFDGFHDEGEKGNRMCSNWEKENRKCRLDVHRGYVSGELECPCHPACRDNSYQYSVSQSEWPTLSYTPYLINILKKRSSSQAIDSFLESLLNDTNLSNEEINAVIRRNFLRVELFFEDLNSEEVREKPEYEFSDLLSDFGGNIGLWIGWSVLTMLEVFVLLFALIKVACHRQRT